MKKDEIRIVAALKSWIKNTEDGFSEEESYNLLRKLIEERSSTLKRRPTLIKFGPDNLPDHQTCYYCNLADEKVEAGGLWHCPNFTCTGPGGHSHRRTLKSYKEDVDGKHTIDIEDWMEEAKKKIKTLEDSPIKEAVAAGIKAFIIKITSTKMGL
jgi:hypothetical protein